jgi:hypothetical protein
MDLTIRLDGFKEKIISLEESRWPTEINVELEPATAQGTDSPGEQPPQVEKKTIQLTSVPPGAEVLMDGQTTGKTPAEITLPDDKPHQIVLKLDGYQEVSKTVDGTMQGPLNVEMPAAAASPGYVKYSGSHKVAIVSGSKVLRGNPVELAPGTYKLTFRSSKDAFVRFTKTIEVKSGETTVVRGPDMGTLTLKAIPSNCKISINGEFIDVAPVLNLPVQVGNHTITFNWETLGKKESKTITVESNQSQTVTGVPEKDA